VINGGEVLRDPSNSPLWDDMICVMEDFLFSRDNSHDKGRMLERCVLKEDRAGMIYLFATYVGFVPYFETDFEGGVFRAVQSESGSTLLLSFGAPSFYSLQAMVMCWSVEGRSELLQVLCDTSGIPKQLVRFAIFELRYATREDFQLPVTITRTQNPSFITDNLISFWNPLDVDLLYSTSDQVL